MTGERSATAATPTRVFPPVGAAGPSAALSIVLLISGCGLIVGDPYIGRGSIGGIEGSAAMVSATFISPDGDNGLRFEVGQTELFDDRLAVPAERDELVAKDHHRDVGFEVGIRYLLFLSPDLSGDTPLLRFAFDVDHDQPVSGHDEPARFADDGGRDGLPLTEVVDCLADQLDLADRTDAVRLFGPRRLTGGTVRRG